MPARALRLLDDPVLRDVAAPVTQFGPELDALIADLFATMYAESGRGIAAPQVGVSRRAFVIDTTWKEGEGAPIAFVNPEILDSAPFRAQGKEACLSIPGRQFDVARPIWIDLAWTSPAGIAQTGRFFGAAAICICHELDHLNGVLISDIGAEV